MEGLGLDKLALCTSFLSEFCLLRYFRHFDELKYIFRIQKCLSCLISNIILIGTLRTLQIKTGTTLSSKLLFSVLPN